MFEGGKGTKGYKIVGENYVKLIHRLTTNNPFTGKHHTDTTKQIIGEKNSVPVIMIDKERDVILKEFSSAYAAGAYLGKIHGNSEIIKVCKGYVSPSNRHYITAFGYRWKYKNDVRLNDYTWDLLKLEE